MWCRVLARRRRWSSSAIPGPLGLPSRGASSLGTPSFESLGVLPELAAAMRTLGFVRPSSPQALALPALLARQSVALASSTGSGKTLAYLLPTLQQGARVVHVATFSRATIP